MNHLKLLGSIDALAASCLIYIGYLSLAHGFSNVLTCKVVTMILLKRRPQIPCTILLYYLFISSLGRKFYTPLLFKVAIKNKNLLIVYGSRVVD